MEPQQVEVIETPEPTRRDVIEQAFAAEDAKASTISDTSATPSKVGEPAPSDTRARGPDGKFIEAPAPIKAKDNKGFVSSKPAAAPAAPAPVAEPAAPPVPRPSSWAKEMWPVWDKLNAGTPLDAKEARQLAEYNAKREGDFAKGVSTYKQEYDRLRPLDEAIAPFLPALQANNINPAQWINNLGQAHHALATGNDQTRLAMFLKLAKDYNVPVQQLFVKAADGQVYYNPQVQAAAPQQQAQAPAPQVNIEQVIEQKLAERQAVGEVQQFMEAKDTNGNPLYPHYETVRNEMAQLLEAGLADDVPSAYQAALRLPQHAEIFDAQLKQKQEAEAAAKAQKAKEEADRARRTAVSVRGRTPANAATANSGKKDRRSQIAEAFDAAVEGARIN
jgi:hypothetical protein